MVANSFAFLEKAARQWPSNVAQKQGNIEYSYKEFRERALAIGGNLLALGLKPGDRVAFCLANSPHILETVFGCFAAGLIVVPINARLHAREIAYICNDSGAKALIHGPEFADGLIKIKDELETIDFRICTEQGHEALSYDILLVAKNALLTAMDARPDDPCWLFYTSGTTGKPKGAIWNHRMVRVVIMNYLADVYNIQPGEVLLHVAPMSHGSGIVALPAIARGATNAISESASFDPDSMLKTVAKLNVSHIAFMAPTQIIKMMEECDPANYDLHTLKAICYGGAPIYVEHLKRAIRMFGPVFAQIYGQGEAPITITGLNAADHLRMIEAEDERIGSAGQVRTDVEAVCVDENDQPLPPGKPGEVVARGDVVMPGYWNNESATAETLRGGWLHTGDIGYFDENNFLFLLDRSKDMIISGGNNIYPREVEEVIIQHPAVANVVVVGVPHEYWGEAVHAVIVREPGENIGQEDVIEYCGENIAGYKKPKSVEFVDELPVSGYGKILRREVRDWYWGDQQTRIGGGQAGSRSKEDA